jgi:hypothetical protein
MCRARRAWLCVADTDVVCFHSRPPAHGACRSLLGVDEGIYRLPPFATVTLVAVHEPGTWEPRWVTEEEGRRAREAAALRDEGGAPERVQRRCYEVTVEF